MKTTYRIMQDKVYPEEVMRLYNREEAIAVVENYMQDVPDIVIWVEDEPVNKITGVLCRNKKGKWYDKKAQAQRNREYYLSKKAEIREEAIDWQAEFGEHNYSWGELAYWQDYFETLGKRYGLLTEFRENAIC